MLIINADDFGHNGRVNAAILRSFREGLCSSTSIMSNMPGFEEACEATHSYGLLNHVGLHLNLGEGQALTDGLKRFRQYCTADGKLQVSQQRPLIFLKQSEKRVLADEIRAQIKRCRNYGIPLTHVDSHRHLHTQFGVLSVLIEVVREEDIPYIRISRNCGPRGSAVKSLYKYFINRTLTRAQLRRTDLFGSVGDYEWALQRDRTGGLDCEVMVHPVLDGDRLTDATGTPRDLRGAVSQIPGHGGAVSYTGSKYSFE